MQKLNTEEEQTVKHIIHYPEKGFKAFALDIQALLVLVIIVGYGIYSKDFTIIIVGVAINTTLQLYLLHYRIRTLPHLKSALQKLTHNEDCESE